LNYYRSTVNHSVLEFEFCLSLVFLSFRNHHTTMATTQRGQLGVLHQALADTTADIIAKEKKLDELYLASNGNSTDRIADLSSSIAALRAEKVRNTEIAATNADIAETNATIEKEKEKLDKLYDVNKDDRDTDRIVSLEKSIAALRTDKATLLASRDKLQHDIATHPNQGQDTQRLASSASGKNENEYNTRRMVSIYNENGYLL
jgi:hypothetical protein